MRLSTGLATALAAMAALGFAACGEKPAATDGATATPAAAEPAATAPAPAAATAPEMEGPAAGKWKITMTAMGQAMPPTETCYAKQTSFAEAQKMQQRAGIDCAEQSYKREGDALVGRTVCTADAGDGKKMTVTTDMRVVGDFKSKYTMDMTSKVDPPVPGVDEQKVSITAERLGDC